MKPSVDGHGHDCGHAGLLRETRERLVAAEAGLWAVVHGTAQGWPMEGRLSIYDAVARGLGGRYVSRGLSGEFVGLRTPVELNGPETAR
jgi:hypothetical protein